MKIETFVEIMMGIFVISLGILIFTAFLLFFGDVVIFFVPSLQYPLITFIHAVGWSSLWVVVLSLSLAICGGMAEEKESFRQKEDEIIDAVLKGRLPEKAGLEMLKFWSGD